MGSIISKIPLQNAIFKSVPRERGSPGPYPNPSQSSSAAGTGRAWNVFGSNTFHTGRPTKLVWVAVHRPSFVTRTLPYIFHLVGVRGPLMPQVSWPTWFKTSRSTLRPPRSFIRISPWLSFTHTPRSSHPTSSQTGQGGMLYRIAPELLTRSRRSSIPLPPTPPHRKPLGASKETKTVHD